MDVSVGETPIQEDARMALDYFIDAKGFDASLIGGYFPIAAADPVLSRLIVERNAFMAESEAAIRQRLELLRNGEDGFKALSKKIDRLQSLLPGFWGPKP